jgi:hypothetical protein
MAGKKQSNKQSLISRAYLLSFPQMLVWAVIFAFVGGLTVWSGLAAPHNGGGGGKGGSSTISLVMVADKNSDGLPNFEDQITFTISGDTTQTFVDASCNQNGTIVYDETHGMWPAAMFGQTFTLGPTSVWSGGAADCSAKIFKWTSNGRQNVLGSMTFHVNP